MQVVVLNILPTYSKQGAQPGSSIAVILSLRESKHSAVDAKGLCYSCDFPEQIFFFILGPKSYSWKLKVSHRTLMFSLHMGQQLQIMAGKQNDIWYKVFFKSSISNWQACSLWWKKHRCHFRNRLFTISSTNSPSNDSRKLCASISTAATINAVSIQFIVHFKSGLSSICNNGQLNDF